MRSILPPSYKKQHGHAQVIERRLHVAALVIGDRADQQVAPGSPEAQAQRGGRAGLDHGGETADPLPGALDHEVVHVFAQVADVELEPAGPDARAVDGDRVLALADADRRRGGDRCGVGEHLGAHQLDLAELRGAG